MAGAVTLTADGLAEDDRRDFVVQVPRELRVLVVDGAPSPVRYRDEVFFLEAALGAPSSPLRPVVRDAEAGLRERFEAYDVVVLANVPAPVGRGRGPAPGVRRGGRWPPHLRGRQGGARGLERPDGRAASRGRCGW